MEFTFVLFFQGVYPPPACFQISKNDPYPEKTSFRVRYLVAFAGICTTRVACLLLPIVTTTTVS